MLFFDKPVAAYEAGNNPVVLREIADICFVLSVGQQRLGEALDFGVHCAL
jgi:hypothetical protein